MPGATERPVEQDKGYLLGHTAWTSENKLSAGAASEERGEASTQVGPVQRSPGLVHRGAFIPRWVLSVSYVQWGETSLPGT